MNRNTRRARKAGLASSKGGSIVTGVNLDTGYKKTGKAQKRYPGKGANAA